MPQRLNDWINDEIERSPEKAEMINENPNIIIDQVFDILPGTMFVLLPMVALILKFWYLFAKRYYIEHLIHSLHNHAFIYVILIILLLLEVAETFFMQQGWATAEKVAAMVKSTSPAVTMRSSNSTATSTGSAPCAVVSSVLP